MGHQLEFAEYYLERLWIIFGRFDSQLLQGKYGNESSAGLGSPGITDPFTAVDKGARRLLKPLECKSLKVLDAVGLLTASHIILHSERSTVRCVTSLYTVKFLVFF